MRGIVRGNRLSFSTTKDTKGTKDRSTGLRSRPAHGNEAAFTHPERLRSMRERRLVPMRAASGGVERSPTFVTFVHFVV
jgi:hypothetical protein